MSTLSAKQLSKREVHFVDLIVGGLAFVIGVDDGFHILIEFIRIIKKTCRSRGSSRGSSAYIS